MASFSMRAVSTGRSHPTSSSKRCARPFLRLDRCSRAAATHAVMPDRIETGTFIAAAAAAGGDVAILGTQPDTLEAVSEKLIEAGAEIAADDSTIRVRRTKPLQSASVRTAPYPSFPTD